MENVWGLSKKKTLWRSLIIKSNHFKVLLMVLISTLAILLYRIAFPIVDFKLRSLVFKWKLKTLWHFSERAEEDTSTPANILYSQESRSQCSRLFKRGMTETAAAHMSVPCNQQLSDHFAECLKHQRCSIKSNLNVPFIQHILNHTSLVKVKWSQPNSSCFSVVT